MVKNTGNPTADSQCQLISILIQADIHSAQGSSIFIALPAHSITHNTCLPPFHSVAVCQILNTSDWV